MDERAFDLAFVERRIEGTAHIMQDVGTLDTVFARQCVDRHFRACCPVSIVIERTPLAFGAVPVNFRRLVETGRRKLHAGKIGLLDEGRKCQAVFANKHMIGLETYLCCGDTPSFCCELDQPRFDLFHRVERSHAVQVGSAGSSGCRRVRHFLSGGLGNLDPLKIDLKRLGDNLCHLGVQPLTHLCAAVVQVD